MDNRLQFRHHGIGSGYTVADGVFDTREDAIDYAKNTVDSLYGEPLVLRYKNEENEDDPYLMILVGSVTNDTNIWRNNRFCVIDVHKTESEISELKEEIEKVVTSLTLIVENSDTLELNAQETEEGVHLSGNVKVPQSHKFDSDTVFKENKLVVDEDGIFIYVDLDYNDNDGTIKFTLNDFEKELNIGTNTVTGGVYNERDECIHLNMKYGDDIVIDVDKLIGEWTVEGEAANSPIVLKREEVEYGGGSTHYHVEPWQDILSADVRIANDRVNNILSKTTDNRYLYVDGVASNISYYKDGSKTNVKAVLDDLVKIKISDDSQNILMKKADGFFASSTLEYISNQNTLVFTTSNQESKVIRLNSFKMFEDIRYDSTTESLVITYIDNEGQTRFVEIPIGEMLRDWEWDVNNYGHSVFLQKERKVHGSDLLSADVRICNLEDNIVTEVAHELYVKGTADNIKYDNALSVKNKIDVLTSEIDAEVQRSTNEDSRLQREIDALSSDTLNKIESIANTDSSISVDNTDAKNPTVKVNISEEVEDGKENIIKLNSDGLYAGVDLDYYFESGTSKNVLVFKTTNGTKTFDLKTNSVVDRIYYDPTRESIIIEYTINGVRMPDVVIPIRDMIDEIDVQSTTTVELTKTKDTSAGRDFIRANAIISTTHDDNILFDDGGLYVGGSQIEENKNKIAENALAIEGEIARATAEETSISTSLNNEVIRAISAETAINNEISLLGHRLADEVSARTSADDSINGSISTLNEKVDSEIVRSTEKDEALQTAITQEVNDRTNAVTVETTRATSAETALQTAINEEILNRTNSDESIQRDLSDEVARATAAEAANVTAIEGEVTRATAAEEAIASSLSGETARATAAEEAIANDLEVIENDYYLAVANTNTVFLSKEAQAKGSLLKANVNISADETNNIRENADGIYSSVDLLYDSTSNKLTFKTTNSEKEISLVSNSIVNKIYYDSTNENIVIEYTVNGERMPDVLVPVRSIINEIDVATTSSVMMTKTEGIGERPDVITAEVILNTVHEDNILIDDGGLYVSGAQIEANKAAIEELQSGATEATEAIDDIIADLSAEIARSTAKDAELDSKIDSEIARATSAEEANATSLANEITRSTEKDNALQAALTQEVNDRITAVTAEQNRAISAETALQTSINEESVSRVNADDTLRRDINDEASRAQGVESAIRSDLEAEVIRATAAEGVNELAISNEVARATTAEGLNATAISDEAARAASEEQRIEAKVDELADSTTYVVRNTNSVTLTKANEERGTSITADVNISNGNGNVIKVETDGLYANVDLAYDATSNKLTFNTTNGSKEIALVSNSLVERVYYDAPNEKIVIVYKVNGETMPDVEVPVRDLINEITVESTTSVEMTKTINIEGSDVISASVRLNTVHDDNILIDDGGLYVSGAQIEANKEAIEEIESIISSSDTKVAELEVRLDSEIARATAAEAANATAIDGETSRATAKESEIASNLSNETARATSAETEIRTALNNEITRSTEKDEALQTALTQEVNERTNAVTAETTRATSAETEIRTALNNEITRSTSVDETNAANISANTNAINAERARAEGVETLLNSAVSANTTAIATEKARAELVESNIANSVSAETARAESEEARIETKIDNEITRAREAEAALNDKIDAKTFEVVGEDTATVDMVVADGNKVSANVLIANGDGNIIKASSDTDTGTGIYASVDLSYDASTNKLKLTTSALEKEIALSIGSILKSIEYDSVAKNLIIKYDTNSAGQIIEQTLTVPVEDLFNDWVVQQGDHLGAIILRKEDGVSGNPDILSAEVVLSTLNDNMLVNDQGALYVSRRPIDEISAVTEEHAELIENIISGSGLGHDGRFNPASVIGRKYISSAQSIMDAAVMLDSAIEGVTDDIAAISGNDTTYSVRLTRDETSKHLSADVKLAQTPNAADIDVTLSHEQYASLTMKNLLKVIHVVESEKDASTNGLFFDGSIDYGSYDNLGNVTYEN